MTDVPVYPTLPAEQIVHPLNDSGTVALFVSNADQAAKAKSVRSELKTVRTVISFNEPKPDGADMTIAELEKAGAALDTEGKAAEFKAAAIRIEKLSVPEPVGVGSGH
jgi:long-chain acyl-CoA synthetase